MEFPYGTDVVPDALIVPAIVPLDVPIDRSDEYIDRGSTYLPVETRNLGQARPYA